MFSSQIKLQNILLLLYMESLVEEINLSLDIELFKFKSFSQTTKFMFYGMYHLASIYNNLRIIPFYLAYTQNGLSKNSVKMVYNYLPKLNLNAYNILYLTVHTTDAIGHANLLVIYMSQKGMICERYDPAYSCCADNSIDNILDNYLKLMFLEVNIKYISPKDMSVIVCPQAYIKDDFGYCQTYCLFYIKNLAQNKEHRLKTMSRFAQQNELDQFIKEVVAYIIRLPKTTKKNANELLRFDILPAYQGIRLLKDL